MEIAYQFGFDDERNRHTIELSPYDNLVWFCELITSCSSIERCDYIIQGLSTAIAHNQAWGACVNEIAMRYHPEQHSISATFLAWEAENVNTMDATVFLDIMIKWKNLRKCG